MDNAKTDNLIEEVYCTKFKKKSHYSFPCILHTFSSSKEQISQSLFIYFLF